MDKTTVFKGGDGWRWHRKSENGEIVSTSGEGYQDRDHAIHMASELNSDTEITVEIEEG